MPRGKAVKKVTIPTELNEQISSWKQLVDWMTQAKPQEHALRQALVEKCGFDITKLEGSESIDIGYGYKLKATKSQSYTATNENHETEQLLAALHVIDPSAAIGLIRWEPVISTKHYKEVVLPLVQSHLELTPLLSACITIKPGMAQLEMIPPKQEESTEPVAIDKGHLVTDGTTVEW